MSPTFAGALWALDWTLRALRAGVESIRFHNHFVPCTAGTYSPLCSSDAEAQRAGRFSPRPEFYALLAARSLEGGRVLRVQVRGSDRVTAYGVRTDSGAVRLVLINLGAGERLVRLRVPNRPTGSMRVLKAGSLTACERVTLGGQKLDAQGMWQPPAARRVRLNTAATFRLRSASAALITLGARRTGR